METTATPLPPVAAPRGSDKIWSMFSHLSGFIGLPFLLPLVVYLAMKGDSEYVAGNAREALNFHLSLIVYGLCCVPLVFIGLGIVLAVALGLFAIVMAIIAAVKASDGQIYRYPLCIRFVR